jgi:hypothetical protein
MVFELGRVRRSATKTTNPIALRVVVEQVAIRFELEDLRCRYRHPNYCPPIESIGLVASYKAMSCKVPGTIVIEIGRKTGWVEMYSHDNSC